MKIFRKIILISIVASFVGVVSIFVLKYFNAPTYLVEPISVGIAGITAGLLAGLRVIN